MRNVKFMEDLYAIILAAGEGKRMMANGQNKVVINVAGTPMIRRTIENLKEAKISNIIVVVGHAKESVIPLLDPHIKMVEQPVRLGTGDAVKQALSRVPMTCRDVIVMNGDDSFLFNKKILNNLYSIHNKTASTITLLTIKVDKPFGLGRIIRDGRGKIKKIAEEKDANEEEKMVNEVNTACYIFDTAFLNEHINEVAKSSVTGEYYITSLVDIAIKHGKKVSTLTLENFIWRGVNTPEELQEAELLFS